MNFEMTPAITFLVIAMVLIAIELLVMQVTFFWFLFFGIGALITAFVCWLVPDISWVAAIGIFLASSLASIAALFPRLKSWQNEPSPLEGNDAIGQSVEVVEAITDRPGKVSWSGTEWPAEKLMGEDDFAVGQRAVIKKAEGITLFVGHN